MNPIMIYPELKVLVSRVAPAEPGNFWELTGDDECGDAEELCAWLERVRQEVFGGSARTGGTFKQLLGDFARHLGISRRELLGGRKWDEVQLEDVEAAVMLTIVWQTLAALKPAERKPIATGLEYHQGLRGLLTGTKPPVATGIDPYATSVLARTILLVLSEVYEVNLSWHGWGWDERELLSELGTANVARLHRVLERKFGHRKFGCPLIVIAYFIFVRHLTRDMKELTPEGRRAIDARAEKLQNQLVMPRLLRIWQIHRRLRREQPVHPQILAAEFEVAEAVIKEDVAIMCDGLGLSVMWSAKKKSYYYGLSHRRLPPVMIRAGDAFALKLSLHTPVIAPGTPAERVATSGLQQVKSYLGNHVWVSLATLDEELTGTPEPQQEPPGRN